MLGLFKIKSLLFGLFIASPVLGFWMLRSADAIPGSQMNQPVQAIAVASVHEKITRIPVEVISKGEAHEWVYVDVGNQAVPEPGSAFLILLSGLLMVFRRQR